MNILFICTGNTCRSPMAEGYLKQKMPHIDVQSRGIGADGSSVSENAVSVMAEIGVDLKDLVSEQLNLADLTIANKIYCMSPSHKRIADMYTNPEKVFVLGDGISDPYGGNTEIYRKCRDEIIKAVDCLIKKGEFDQFSVSLSEEKHINSIAKLEKECFSEPWSEKVLLDAYKKGTTFFVAAIGEKVVGYVGINTVLDEGYITNIAVTEKYRKRGVASALMERVFSLAKDEGLSFVTLEVRKSNAGAISLYNKLEFKQEGKRKNFYSNPKEDALIMTKRFD